MTKTAPTTKKYIKTKEALANLAPEAYEVTQRDATAM